MMKQLWKQMKGWLARNIAVNGRDNWITVSSVPHRQEEVQ